jgi:hypothetical protein
MTSIFTDLKSLKDVTTGITIDGNTLTPENKYHARLNNCISLYMVDNEKEVTAKPAKDGDFNLKVKLGVYKGARTTSSNPNKKNTYLLFNLDTKFFLIPQIAIISIENDTGAAGSAAGLGAAVPPAVPTTGLGAAVPPAVPTTGLGAAVPPAVPTTGLDAASTASGPAAVITPNASQLQKPLDESQLENNKLNSLQEIGQRQNNTIPPISTQKSSQAFNSAFEDQGEEVTEEDVANFGGGKRRTSKRRGGASKKRVSKKERKTRKAKRAGRKA